MALARQWIEGIDVSSANGNVDFTKVHEAGYRFAIVKATEGVGYVSPKFFEHWEKLQALDGAFYRGAYHFCRPDSIGGTADGHAEAMHLIETLDSAGMTGRGCFPPVLDFEKRGKGKAMDRAYLDAIVGDLADHFGRLPMIYTGMNVWAGATGNYDAFTGCPLWVVRYTKSASPLKAMRSLPWSEWTLWQWSGGGAVALGPRVPGCPTTTDLNRFAGGESQLAALAGIGGDVTEPPDDGVPDPYPHDEDTDRWAN